MNRFDKRVKQILNEGIFSAIGAGLKAAKDPGQGLLGMAAGIGAKRKEKEEKKGQVFSNNNPPKMGQLVVTKAPVYGLGEKEKNPDYDPNILTTNPKASARQKANAKEEYLPAKLVTINPNVAITGKITKQIDAKGLYGVALIGLDKDKNIIPTKYVFAQTKSAPIWQVYDATKTPDADILVDSKGISMKLPAIMTGLASDNASEPLKNWMDYDTYLNQLRNPKK